MPKGPAARITDLTMHGGPLVPGPPSFNVFIGKLPAWLGMTAAAAAALVKVVADGAKDVAEKTAKDQAAQAAAPTGGPAGAALAVKTKKDLVKAQAKAVANATAAMVGAGVSINACPVIKLLIPDGIGVVITPSQTVLINKWGACRMGDTIQEITSVNAIAKGEPTVIIGG